jgi:chemotaxis methyl-accepting protein methylase
MSDALGDDDEAYRALLTRIHARGAFACGSYRDGCLRRRLAVRMRACRTPTYAAYAAHLEAHPAEWARLLAALTINVTQFFRNPEVWEALATRVVPALWRVPGPLRIWSAGCASGEEPWGLAMLFHAHAAAVGAVDQLPRVAITATDIDVTVLAAAAAAQYRPAALREMPATLRETYLVGEPATVIPALHPLVRFVRHDLHLDPPLPGRFHLIVCRNVLIYFEPSAQDAVLQRFHTALVPGGQLVVGNSEALLGAARRWFVPQDPAVRLFAKVGA